LACAPTLLILWVIANDWVMANDLDHLDGTEGGPQPAQGRELVIVDLGHLNHHAATMAGASGCCLASRPLIRRD
jgi:hypothetical protein